MTDQAAMFFYSRDRGGEHPAQHLARYAGLMQADAYAGFNRLYEANRKPGPIIEAACWAHRRRKFYDLARATAECHRRPNGVSLLSVSWQSYGAMCAASPAS
jgi:Transposase IS66 family